jgi:membrane protease YdiL (CAAX protease family)
VTELSTEIPSRRHGLIEVLGASCLLTVLVTAVSVWVPERYVATSVGLLFLAATYALVWRRDDAYVEACGLGLGGLVLSKGPGARATLHVALKATALALGTAALVFVPFFFGWRSWWRPKAAFSLTIPWYEILNESLGQLIIIALPEEAFYRGYMQSRLDQVFPGRVRVLGAELGLGVIITSVIFALGHLATIRDATRLAVFFPSLLFGWMRARSKGVGAGVLFHALCNVFSELLGHGFHLY